MRSISTVFVVAVSTVGLSQFARAADMPVKAPPIVAAPYNWTGFYAGVNAGYAWGGSNDIGVASNPLFVNTTNFGNPILVSIAATGGTTTLSPDSNGFIGGVQAGYNWQSGSIVTGIEADFQGLAHNDSSATLTSVLTAPNSPLVTNITASQQLDWLGTLRGRLGFTATPTLLAYVTGGLAYGEAKSSITMTQSHVTAGHGVTSGTLAASYSNVRAGWTLGGGIEWAFARNWSAKAEYLYYDLGTATYGGTLTSVTTDALTRYIVGTTASADFTGNIVRAGLNYKF